MSTISTHTGFVYLMVLVSASDRNMTDKELKRMGYLVDNLPIFSDYDSNRLVTDAESCAEILQVEDGLEAVLGLVSDAVPESHRDTAYALACEIAAADGKLSQEEVRLLEMIRHELDVDRLTAAAIERGIAARYRRL
ncbi:MAG: tellurite resistance TerB family protein [Sphingomonadales bacterium]|nr:tellurite resistance TerB family protein [Sphingomonadales bacterium]